MTKSSSPAQLIIKMVGLLVAVGALLSGCAAAPTRAEPDKFKLLGQAQIPRTNVGAFAECLLDGFDKAHFMLTNSTARQQRRTDSFRVETLVGGRILITSADVFDDGRVMLYEANSAMLINTSGEREAFARCVDRYK